MTIEFYCTTKSLVYLYIPPFQISTNHWSVHYLSFVFVITHTNGITQYVAFQDWLISLINPQLRISHVFEQLIPHFFKSLDSIPSHGCLSIPLLKSVSSLLIIYWRLPHGAVCLLKASNEWNKWIKSSSMEEFRVLFNIIKEMTSQLCLFLLLRSKSQVLPTLRVRRLHKDMG